MDAERTSCGSDRHVRMRDNTPLSVMAISMLLSIVVVAISMLLSIAVVQPSFNDPYSFLLTYREAGKGICWQLKLRA
jgi:hypothetical protein